VLPDGGLGTEDRIGHAATEIVPVTVVGELVRHQGDAVDDRTDLRWRRPWVELGRQSSGGSNGGCELRVAAGRRSPCGDCRAGVPADLEGEDGQEAVLHAREDAARVADDDLGEAVHRLDLICPAGRGRAGVVGPPSRDDREGNRHDEKLFHTFLLSLSTPIKIGVVCPVRVIQPGSLSKILSHYRNFFKSRCG